MIRHIRRIIQVSLFTVVLVFSSMLIITSFDNPSWAHFKTVWHHTHEQYSSGWFFGLGHDTHESYVGGFEHTSHNTHD